MGKEEITMIESMSQDDKASINRSFINLVFEMAEKKSKEIENQPEIRICKKMAAEIPLALESYGSMMYLAGVHAAISSLGPASRKIRQQIETARAEAQKAMNKHAN